LEIRTLVAPGRAANISAFVKHALQIALYDAAGWNEMLEEALQQTGGALTKKERASFDSSFLPALFPVNEALKGELDPLDRTARWLRPRREHEWVLDKKLPPPWIARHERYY